MTGLTSTTDSAIIRTKPSNGSTVALAIMAIDKVKVDLKRPQIIYVAPTFDAAFVFRQLLTMIPKSAEITIGIVSQSNQGTLLFSLNVGIRSIVKMY